jgi:hypothetical protein
MRIAIGVFLLATTTLGLAEPFAGGTLSFKQNNVTITSVTINAPAGVPSIGTSTPVDMVSSGGKVTWHAAVLEPAATWLSVTPTDGTLNGSGSVQLNIFVDVMNPVVLTPNTYNAHIRITGTQTNSPLDLPVTLIVSTNAVISVTPDTLTFAAATNATPAAQSFTLKNLGGSPLAWTATTASTPAGWVHVSPASSSAAGGDLAPGATVSISVQLDALSTPNTYSGSVTIKENSTVQSKVVQITYTVSSLGQISLSPASLSFDAPTNGGDPTPQFLSLSNSGGQDLNWSVAVVIDAPASPTGWLSVDVPLSGILTPGSAHAITVRIDNSPAGTSLPEGTYQGHVTVSGTSGGSAVTAQTTNVVLNVISNPQLSVTPDNASFTASVDSTAAAPIGVSILNSGSGTLGWSLSGGPPWLTASPVGGSLAALGSVSLILTANAAGLAPGVYTSTFQVIGVNQSVPAPYPPASNSPQTITVTLTVLKSSKPTEAPAGQCGLSGLEGLFPVLAFLIRRRIAKRGAIA